VLGLLVLAFVVLPLAELYVIVQVGHAIGFLDTLALLFFVSLFGAWLARREGFGVLQRLRERLDRGEMPTRELIDGALILSGGLLLLVPGFITDVIGALLLLPPTRALVRMWLRHRFAVQVVRGLPRPPGRPPGGAADGNDVIDL
jgi:UPF0716 protein FxsA